MIDSIFVLLYLVAVRVNGFMERMILRERNYLIDSLPVVDWALMITIND